MRYQPEWIDGKTVGTSRRDAEGRYAAIARELDGMYGFTVLDLGAHAGYFSLRLAEEFGANVTAVDDAAELAATLDKVPHPQVTGFFQKVDPRGLEHLGQFDVALCLSVLHHVTWWRSMIHMLIKQSRKLIIESAHPDEVLPGAIAHSQEIIPMIELHNGRKIHESPGFDDRFLRPMFVIDRTET